MVLTFSSTIPNDWVLVQWDNGDYSTVCEQAVLSSMDMLKKGDEMSFIWHGEQRKAKFITRARGQRTLEASMRHANRQQKAGRSYRKYDWPEDNSPSCSDWVPRDDTTTEEEEYWLPQDETTEDEEEDWVPRDETTEDEEEEDSDKDNKKRVQLERYKRQININRSNKRKKATPSLRATLVLPKTILPRKKTHISSLQNDQSKRIMALREQLYDLLTDVLTATKIAETSVGFKVIVPTKYKAENQSVVEDVTENEEANSEHEEHSSSDNNVLISNKHNIVRAFSANYPSGSFVSNPSGPSISNPSGPTVSNPSGSSASKKIRKAENKDRTRYNRSVKEDVSEDEEDVAFKLREGRMREVMNKMLKKNSRTSVSNPSRSSVSNPSVPSTSKKYNDENTDRTRYIQSVKEDVSKDEEDVALKLRDARGREAMAKMFEDNLRSSVTNPSRSSVSNPSGSSTSKKYKAENTDQARYNQSVEEDVLEYEEDVALILRREHEAMIKTLQDNLRSSESNLSRSSVSYPSGSSTSKKYKAENTNRARYNQSVEEDVLKNEEDVALKFRNARAREAMIKMPKNNLIPSVSNPSRSSVSNPSRPSTSKTYKAENTEQSRHNQSVEEVVTEDEEETSEHEEFNRSDDNVLITNKHRNVTVKTVHKDDEWVPIGTGKTQISRDKYMKVNWKSYTIATRTLLLAVFPRRVLATHSLTGKKSPAFQDKPAKNCLDPKKTSDVIFEIKKRFKVKESLIRSIITTKCADECKMFKTRNSKNNENMPPATNGEEE